MIKEITMYTAICDNCKCDVCEIKEYSCWDSKGFAEDIAIELDWIEEYDKHYCPDCYEYGDNDELIIKTARFKP